MPSLVLLAIASVIYSSSRPLPPASISAPRSTGLADESAYLRRPRCSDRKDNDRDGKIDYPRDPGCKSRKDDSEKNSKPTPTPTATPTASPNPTPTVTPTSGDGVEGAGASLRGRVPFPADNAWNTDISNAPVDSRSDTLIASMGRDTGLHPDFGSGLWEGSPIGIPYIVVRDTQAKVPVSFYYNDESDPGPYPVPATAPIEGGTQSNGDRHVLVVDWDNWILYELYSAYSSGDGWQAGSGAVFNLNSNDLRPAGWTSADAAGLPIFPGLVRYDEAGEQGEINHALRFTAQSTRRAYVSPARHFASSNTSTSLPPMGMRVRLKASVDISGYPPRVQVILRALKRYGMFLADNGSNWFISGAPDERWDNDELRTLRNIKGQDFEVVEMGPVITE